MFHSSRLHAYTRKRYDSFIRAVHSRVQGCKKSLSLHSCILASLTAVVQSFPPPKYTQTVIICLSVSASPHQKNRRKGSGFLPNAEQGAWRSEIFSLENCHVPAVKVADFAHEMKRMWNAPVLITRIGLSKRIMGSTYLLGHFLSAFTQFSHRSLRYELLSVWYFSNILKRFLKCTPMNRKVFFIIVHHCVINGCDYFGRSSNAWKNASRA